MWPRRLSAHSNECNNHTWTHTHTSVFEQAYTRIRFWRSCSVGENSLMNQTNWWFVFNMGVLCLEGFKEYNNWSHFLLLTRSYLDGSGQMTSFRIPLCWVLSWGFKVLKFFLITYFLFHTMSFYLQVQYCCQLTVGNTSECTIHHFIYWQYPFWALSFLFLSLSLSIFFFFFFPSIFNLLCEIVCRF